MNKFVRDQETLVSDDKSVRRLMCTINFLNLLLDAYIHQMFLDYMIHLKVSKYKEQEFIYENDPHFRQICLLVAYLMKTKIKLNYQKLRKNSISIQLNHTSLDKWVSVLIENHELLKPHLSYSDPFKHITRHFKIKSAKSRLDKIKKWQTKEK